jgi:glycosyltransferase involved in cell wall biosynthesis
MISRPARAGGRTGRETVRGAGVGAGNRGLRVATVITRLEGGAGVLALRGAQVLGSETVTPTIVTGSGGRLIEEAAASGIEVLVEPMLREVIAPRSDLQAIGKLESIFRERDFDVVHTHCAKAGAVGRMAARRAGVPRIVHTYHGFPFHRFQSPVRRQAYVAIERRLGRTTDVALCVGSAVAAEAIQRGLIAPERVTTIGVAVDGPERLRASMNAGLPEARRRARAVLGLPGDATVVGAVGRLTYQKAPEDFIAAMREVGRPGVIGIWIGGGELAERVARQAAGLPPGVRVILAGERTDVLDVLPALDVFAMPSRYEGLPTAIVEAMICGIPVVATAVNSVPDLVIPGVTGMLVPPRRPSQLAAAVRHLLDSPDAAARMADVARARVADQYGEPALRSALSAAYTAADLAQPVTHRGSASHH